MHNTSLSQIIWLSTMAGVVCHKCRVHRCSGRVCQHSWGVLFTQDDLVGMIFVTVMVPWFILSLHSPLHLHLQSVYYLIIIQTRYNIKMASNINVIFIYLCCPWIVEICKVAEDGAGYVITKSDDLYMGSVTATLAHQVQTFCLLPTPSSCS